MNKGSLYAIASGLCYGLIGYFGIRIIQEDLSVSCMLFWRFFIASLFMGLLILAKRDWTGLISKDSIKAFLSGFFFYGTSTTLYFIASLYLGTGLAMVIFFTFPGMVMLINSLFFKAPFYKTYLAAFAVTMLGMIFLVDTAAFSADLWAIGICLFCAFLYASYIIASKRVTLDSNISTLMVSTGCMMTSFILSLVEGGFFIPETSTCWFNIICMGLIGTAIPILLLLAALKYISSEKASLLSVLEPVFVVIFGILLLGEEVSGKEIAGMGIILSGTILTLIGGKEARSAAN